MGSDHSAGPESTDGTEETGLLRQIVDTCAVRLGQWQGCYWITAFGQGKLNLRGISSAQALAAARATHGDESRNWEEAAEWLRSVERDALSADSNASRAVEAMLFGDRSKAHQLAVQACRLELQYHDNAIWRPLLELIDRGYNAATNPQNL